MRTELTIEGMTCAACVARLERALSRVPGVERAEVNLAAERAVVTHDLRVGVGELCRAVEDAGFGAAPFVGARPSEVRGEAVRRDLALSIGLSAPVLAASMFWHPRPEAVNWLLLLLATPVVFWCGRGFFAGALANFRHGGANMDTLVALGTLASWGASLAALVRYSGAPHQQSQHVYFESGAVIVTLVLTGRYLEARARGRASAAIERLLALVPSTATRLTEGGEESVAIAEIRPGDRLRLRPAERVAVDGEVLEGESYVDEAMLTGEPEPRAKLAGDLVTAGTINGSGTLVYVARRVGADTVLSQIVRMVERAQGSKAGVQRLADRVSGVFVPVVAAISLATFVGWLVFGGKGFEGAALPAVAVLVVACPCALGLATPSAIMVGVGRGSELGMLIKDGPALERAGRIDAVALDKTGTLTLGKPSLRAVASAGALPEDEVLRMAGAAESPSEHPLGRAIAEAAGDGLPPVEGFESLTGRGVRARVRGREVLVGSRALLAERGVPVPEALLARAERAEIEGATAMLLAVDGVAEGLLCVADAPALHSREAVERLRAMGLRTVMLTGDNPRAAASVAREAGVERFEAEVAPGDKAAAVARLQAEGLRVAMVGDGANDAPALAQADLGIAMGAGTDVAIEAAGVTLLGADLRGVPAAIELARATLRTIRWNLVWAFGYNVLMLPLAASGALNPMVAAAAMSLSSVTVVGNSLRLRRFEPRWSNR